MELLTAAFLAVRAAVAAFGRSAVEESGQEAADAGARLGRSLTRRLLERAPNGARIKGAVEDLAEEPDSEEAQSALRLQLRKALSADPQLAREVEALLREGGSAVTASGSGSVAIGGNFQGVSNTGDGASITVNFGRG